jgi:hypothetical protein
MVSVEINGQPANFKTDGFGSIAEIVEMIKASIDPSHMITELVLNGNELQDSDWGARTNQYPTIALQARTGTPAEFVRERFSLAWEVVNNLYVQFRDARKCFQAGQITAGNRQLVGAVSTSKAFFEWYASILGLVKPEDRKPYDIGDQVLAISETCKDLCQQQLYQSWWALSESIANKLEPQLDKLEDACRKFAV